MAIKFAIVKTGSGQLTYMDDDFNFHEEEQYRSLWDTKEAAEHNLYLLLQHRDMTLEERSAHSVIPVNALPEKAKLPDLPAADFFEVYEPLTAAQVIETLSADSFFACFTAVTTVTGAREMSAGPIMDRFVQRCIGREFKFSFQGTMTVEEQRLLCAAGTRNWDGLEIQPFGNGPAQWTLITLSKRLK